MIVSKRYALIPLLTMIVTAALGAVLALLMRISDVRLILVGAMMPIIVSLLLMKRLFHVGVWLAFALMSTIVFSLDPTDILIVTCLITGLVSRRFRSTQLNLPPTLRLLFAMFFLSFAISVLSGSYIVGRVNWAFVGGMLLRFMLFIFTVMYVSSHQALRVVFAGYLTSALFAVAVALLGTLGILQWEAILPPADEIRVHSLMGDPNVLGSFLVPILIWLLDETLSSKLWKGYGVVKMCLILLVTVTLLLTLSRGAWINMGVALTVYTLIALAKRRLRSVVYIIAVVTGLVPLGIWAIDRLGYSQWILLRTSVDAGDLYRFEIQRMALETVTRHVTGVGPGLSESVLGMQPHNVFVQVLVENGWISAIAFVGILGLTIWTLVQRMRKDDSRIGISHEVILVSLIGLIVNGLVIDVVYWRILWLLMALAFVQITPLRSLTGPPKLGMRRASGGVEPLLPIARQKPI